jgi:hypothetical protein
MDYKLVMNTRQFGYIRKNDVKSKELQLSKGGKAFQSDPDVLSVWVGNEKGQTGLYLVKDPVTSACIKRERNEID